MHHYSLYIYTHHKKYLFPSQNFPSFLIGIYVEEMIDSKSDALKCTTDYPKIVKFNYIVRLISKLYDFPRNI